MRTAGERLFDAAVLVAEGDLEMQYLLASTLKTEVARLDHARMHGTDGNLVDLASIDAKEVAVRGRVAIRAPYGLEPRMALGCEAVLLPDLALEQWAWDVCGERGWLPFTGVGHRSVLSASSDHGTRRTPSSGTPNHAHNGRHDRVRRVADRTAGNSGTSAHGNRGVAQQIEFAFIVARSIEPPGLPIRKGVKFGGSRDVNVHGITASTAPRVA